MIKRKVYGNCKNRDLDILNILWQSEQPMTASQIAASKTNFTINMVQPVLRKLLKQGLIEVHDIVQSGTVFCRCYRPVISSREFALAQFAEEFEDLKTEVSVSALVTTALDTQKSKKKKLEEIKQLEHTLEEYKKTL